MLGRRSATRAGEGRELAILRHRKLYVLVRTLVVAW